MVAAQGISKMYHIALHMQAKRHHHLHDGVSIERRISERLDASASGMFPSPV
jgi:hypothetical protein